MSHLILLGDSIFDNGVYVPLEPDVITQVRQLFPDTWQATLLAVDGAVIDDIQDQLKRLPEDASHLAMSIGGNDALMRIDLLNKVVHSSAEAFLLLEDAVASFEILYRKMIQIVLDNQLPLLLCTIYNANFDDPIYRQCVRLAVAAYNDVIIRIAAEYDLSVIDLRLVCSSPQDYANTIEPSAIGGEKIAQAIVDQLISRNSDQSCARIYGFSRT